ncbi:hypothetical protein M413DRAFT_28978 [Hebeloma cylindrosporum]|uniref:ASTRA-associated protein 1 n=1 Tax=Hebeloma cylindrosporum TaxID=76867 RepID=A0A0C3C875_HEBCY|nr:hypothetical protein M413DRAFT_28978 [Hebeloma cylindrosporum h7]
MEPPTPLHLLRSHSHPISALALSDDNERIYSADTSGKISVTSTRSLRAITTWDAHTDSILGVEEWDKYIVSHGRDNKVHVWLRIEDLPFSSRIGGSAGLPSLPTPSLAYSLDVNALNFCRFSLLNLPTGCDKKGEPKALICLPNLIDSSTADIWHFPSLERVHAAIGQEVKKSIFSADPGGRNTSGKLSLLAAYENGSVVLREYNRKGKEVSIEGEGWDVIWTSKLHVESIMAMRVSRTHDFALTVSADHIIGRYDLIAEKSPTEQRGVAYRTSHPGIGSVAIRDDGKVCAIGGWDGRIRLYSTRSLKPLGTLKYHKSACQCVEFARSMGNTTNLDDESTDPYDDEEMGPEEKLERSRWLIAGAKDNRISIWQLISFQK